MQKKFDYLTFVVAIGGLAAAAFAAWLVFLRTPVVSEQIGFRGVAMETPRFASDLAELEADNAHDDPLDPVVEVYPLDPPLDDEPLAGEVYENVQVLGHLTDGQFNRIMAQVTEWVAPVEGDNAGCLYCHNPENYASDDIYTKIVSRRMFQMTMAINADWGDHVAPAGVNCYTCHRGMPVPEYLWFRDPMTERLASEGPRFIGERNGQNMPTEANGFTDLDVDPFSRYILESGDSARVIEDEAITSDLGASIQDTEHLYSLMIHWSRALGVNCTYCHNSRIFSSWDQSPPTRVRAWYARRMLQVLNADYLDPLQPVYPEHRLGELGDAPLANCATCHQGAPQPLLGADMVSRFPSLTAPGDPGLQDAPFWPTLGGAVPDGWPTGSGTMYQPPEDQASILE